LPQQVATAFARAGIPTTSVGAYVQDIGDGRVLVDANAAAPFNPASTMKLVTTDAALELLGPTYTWKTRAYASGTMAGDVLQGDLIIKGGGDPKLVMESFWLFLRQIRSRGIREIRGNVLLERSLFEPALTDASAFDGDPLKPYNAAPDALLLNYETIGYRFLPDIDAGTVRVVAEPDMRGYGLKAPRLGAGECGDWKAKLAGAFPAGAAAFEGSYPASCGEKIWYVHPWQLNRADYAGVLFRQLWSELGGTLTGTVRDGPLPAGARQVAEWESPALPEIIRDINKYSNNVMARQLLMGMSAELLRLPGSPERGARAVKSWLAGKGIAAPELVIENGSGLSRQERISAATMGQVLASAFRAPTMPEFMSSLPLAGYDGTMRRRVKNRSVAGNAHIKTGSLDEVRAIAGYVLAASGKRYAVVCLVNHRNAPAAQEANDLLLQWVYDNG
jgi:D-alanyl-D-alanine carboxypeptidase/D-alanyl-D-alanine-endopeptidase (penicillin-binding protein 4)